MNPSLLLHWEKQNIGEFWCLIITFEEEGLCESILFIGIDFRILTIHWYTSQLNDNFIRPFEA